MNGVVERLLVFLESSYSHIVAETLVQLKDLLRRYPDLGQVGKGGRFGWTWRWRDVGAHDPGQQEVGSGGA